MVTLKDLKIGNYIKVKIDNYIKVADIYSESCQFDTEIIGFRDSDYYPIIILSPKCWDPESTRWSGSQIINAFNNCDKIKQLQHSSWIICIHDVIKIYS